jgi:hypothetical protein
MDQQVVMDFLKSDVFIKVVMSGITFLIIMGIGKWCDSFMTRFLAFLKFKGSMIISKGVTIRHGTSTGSFDAKVKDCTMSFIICESDEGTLTMPTKTFPERDWFIVKAESDVTVRLTKAEKLIKKLLPLIPGPDAPALGE